MGAGTSGRLGCWLQQTAIEVDYGPEVLTGSTRLKAETAQKLILSMISTASMVGIGKAYQNLMVDVQATNKKLEVRSIRIIRQATEVSEEAAPEVFQAADKNVKLAIVMILTGDSAEGAKVRLDKTKGFIHQSIKSSKKLTSVHYHSTG